MSLCDGCEKIFKVDLAEFNAKKWRPSLCNVPYSRSESCSNIDCDYNIDGEACVDFLFCEECLVNKKVFYAVFVNFAKL